MQSHPPQQSVETDSHSHRGPLSRTWPQLFKKRRRYSPVRESAQQAQSVQHNQHQYNPPPHHAHVQPQPQPPLQPPPELQISVPLRPVRHPSISTASIRSPSMTADTASSISTLSEVSSLPQTSTSKRVPIARRTSSIATTDSNGMSSSSHSKSDCFLY